MDTTDNEWPYFPWMPGPAPQPRADEQAGDYLGHLSQFGSLGGGSSGIIDAIRSAERAVSDFGRRALNFADDATNPDRLWQQTYDYLKQNNISEGQARAEADRIARNARVNRAIADFMVPQTPEDVLGSIAFGPVGKHAGRLIRRGVTAIGDLIGEFGGPEPEKEPSKTPGPSEADSPAADAGPMSDARPSMGVDAALATFTSRREGEGGNSTIPGFASRRASTRGAPMSIAMPVSTVSGDPPFGLPSLGDAINPKRVGDIIEDVFSGIFRRKGQRPAPKDQNKPPREDVKVRSVGAVLKKLENLRGLSDDAKAYLDHMLEMHQKALSGGLSARDVIKGHFITTTSMQRQAIPVGALRKAGIEIPEGVEYVRPEEAAALWLKTPMGQKYLNAAEKGQPDREAIADAVSVLDPFGHHTALVWNLKAAAEKLPGLEKTITDMVQRGAPIDEWRILARSLPGIKDGKVGFFAATVGHGGVPVLDARVRDALIATPNSADLRLRKKEVDELMKLAERVYKRLPDEGFNVGDRFRPFVGHQMLWGLDGHPGQMVREYLKALRTALLNGEALPGSFGYQPPGPHSGVARA
jgi:hypothetical protein